MANDLFDIWGAMKASSYNRALDDLDDIVQESKDMEESIKKGLERISVVLRCEAYTFWVYQLNGNGMIRPLAFSGGSDISNIRLFPGEGIVGQVIESGEPLIIEDCQKHERFKKDVDKKTGFITKSMICVPTKSHGVTYGCIQVINRKNESFFDSSDFEMCKSVAEKFSEILEKYDVLKNYFGYDFEKMQLSNLKASRRNVAVMVASFTDTKFMLNKLDLEQAANMNSTFKVLLANCAAKYNGSIVQSFNDNFEIVFNLYGDDDKAIDNMIDTSLEVKTKFNEYKKEVSQKYGIDINIIIFCNYGECYCSYMGNLENKEYVPFGPATLEIPLMAKLIEGSNHNNDIIISEYVYDEIRKSRIAHVERIRNDKGLELPFDVYEIREVSKY